MPTVAGLPDGGFIVTWTDAPKMGAATVHARRFDASGAPAGDAFLLDAGKPGQSFSASPPPATATSSPPGSPVRTPIRRIPTSEFDGQIFQPATETVNGTEGNDTITTYGLSEPINGLGGKDTINAAGGNDGSTAARARTSSPAAPGSTHSSSM